MKRYCNYYYHLAKVTFMSLLEYRSDIIASTVGTYAYTAMMIIFIQVLFSKIHEIGGWNQFEILFLFGISQIIFYTHFTFFWATYDVIPNTIWRGELDLMLLRPIHALFQMLVSQFNLVEALPSFLIPLLTLSYAWSHLDIHLQTLQILVGMLALVLGITTSTMVHICLALLAFWITDTRPIQRTYAELEDLRKYPLTIYPESLRWIMLTIVPIGLVAYVPTYMFIRTINSNLFITLVGVCGFFALLLFVIWKQGIRRYDSVSS